MGDETGISWTNRTWNPWIGCHKVSPGCFHCYAEYEVEVFPMGKGPGAFRTLWRTKTWGNPPKWDGLARQAGRRDLVFTCSMSDFFHEDADVWRAEAWAVIKATPSLEYQILTKRPERIANHLPADWGPQGYPNVWLGTSVENQKYADLRIPLLLKVPAKVHFLSCEPLLGPVVLGDWLRYCDTCNETGIRSDGFQCEDCLGYKRISWVIVGGESGPGHRMMDQKWADDLGAECAVYDVAFFGKQRSGPRNELPLLFGDVEIKEFPRVWDPRIAAPLIQPGA